MKASFVRKVRGVTNQSFMKEIAEGVEDGLITTGVRWDHDSHREAFLDLIEDWLDEFKQKNEITQYEVRCDGRNNTPADNQKGIYTVLVRYTRWNCLQATEIEYTIYDPPKLDDLDMYEIQF